jgi:hypothetical protein
MWKASGLSPGRLSTHALTQYRDVDHRWAAPATWCFKPPTECWYRRMRSVLDEAVAMPDQQYVGIDLF